MHTIPVIISAQDRAYAYIKERIINLELRPGDRLRAQDLAKQLRISRTPVRETLSRLEQEGLVARAGGWGYVVCPVSLREILDLFRVRESLEVQAALEALPHINKEMLAALKQALAEAKRSLKKKNLAEFRAANQQFRLLIAEFTGNTLLQRLLRMINDRIRLVGALHLDVRKARADEALSENFAILDGIRKRVPAAVEAAVLLHIRNSREGIVQSAIGAAGGSTYLRKL